MKTVLMGLIGLAVLNLSAEAQQLNKLTKAEQKAGWSLLFNGTNTDGWHPYLNPGVKDSWKVSNGVVSFDTKAKVQADLITDKEYENFELSLEWNISEGGNSGIILDVHEDPSLRATYDSGWEIQVLDDKKAEDNKQANHLAGSLYDMIAPAVPSVKPPGQWNTVKIIKNNGEVTAWLNGKQTVHFQLWGDDWKKMVANSKFKTWKNFAAYKKGHIALQQHGAVVSYRNIKIKQL